MILEIRLRGHHLLCVQGFQGYGYNQDFIENMEHIKSLLKNKNTMIRILNSSDDICRFCPNLTEEKLCKNEKYNQTIQKMDNEVINKLNIKNNEINSEELFNKVNQLFKSKKSIDKICNRCMWINECLWAKSIYEK